MSRLFALFLLPVLALGAACSNDNPVAPGYAPAPAAPSLTCPSDITETGVTGGSRIIEYVPPAPSGGHPPVSSSCAPVSGSAFPLGETLVTCLATDSLNRQRTCSFTVTLTPLTLKAMKIVAFGDSITEGENGEDGDGPCPARLRTQCIDVPNAYPAVLANRLREQFPSQAVTVINAGISGRLAQADVDRLPGVLDTHEPDVLLILHGFNDLRREGTPVPEVPSVPPVPPVPVVPAVIEAIREQILIARAAGVQHVYVSTLLPPGPGSRMLDSALIEDVNEGLRAMVPLEGARLVDTYPRFLGKEPLYVAPDGLHLTPAGYHALAESFFDAITSTLTALRVR